MFSQLFGSGSKGSAGPRQYTHQQRGDLARAAHRMAQLYDEAIARAKAATDGHVRAQQIQEARRRMRELESLIKGNDILKMKNMADCEAELNALEAAEPAPPDQAPQEPR
jgi:hypothetical protein